MASPHRVPGQRSLDEEAFPLAPRRQADWIVPALFLAIASLRVIAAIVRAETFGAEATIALGVAVLAGIALVAGLRGAAKA
jgi:hypothetical protein